MTALKKLIACKRGNISILTAISLPILLVAAGGVVDYVSLTNSKARIQAAVDAGLLGAVSTLRDMSDDDPDAYKAALLQQMGKWLSSNLDAGDLTIDDSGHISGGSAGRLRLVDLSLQVDSQAGTVSAALGAEYEMIFLKYIGFDKALLAARSQVKQAFAGEMALEIALVLDNTGSMSGSKINELKQAARGFIDSLYAKKSAPGNENVSIKVGIVPFTSYVNVGKNKKNQPWLDAGPWTGRNKAWRCAWQYSGHWWWRCRKVKWKGVVGSRPDPDNKTDIRHNLNKTPAIAPMFYYGNAPIWGSSIATMTPLTELDASSLTTLKNKINNMNANGWTYIPAGLAWGWRMLSHHKPFNQGASDEDVVEKNVRKVIVLMTDGANTCRPYAGDNKHPQCSVSSSQANQIMQKLCHNIRQINPGTGRKYAEIITVSFDLGNSPSDLQIKQLLASCATMGHYDAQQGGLSDVFDNIGRKLVKLHLSR